MMRKDGLAILALQDTHIDQNTRAEFKDNWPDLRIIARSYNDKESAGVAILLDRV